MCSITTILKVSKFLTNHKSPNQKQHPKKLLFHVCILPSKTLAIATKLLSVVEKIEAVLVYMT
jgi:hypothetical protein